METAVGRRRRRLGAADPGARRHADRLRAARRATRPNCGSRTSPPA
ncbi:hypothetical protein AB5I41_11255 [Sphingomonas sp. MMS24-JH45]